LCGCLLESWHFRLFVLSYELNFNGW
jgi:hypothetical protein